MHGNAKERLEACFGTNAPVALVTGSLAPRLGSSIASHLLQQGYRVIYHAHEIASEELRQRAKGLRATDETLVLEGAIEDEPTVEQWLTEIQSTFGRLDALVHTAAIWESKPLEHSDSNTMRKQWEVNTLGSYLVARAAGLLMAKQPTGGALVFLGDWAILRPYQDFTAYLLSKGALPTLTRTLAVELATRNPKIRVNCILPGPVLLDPKIDAESREKIRCQSLLKRLGQPADIANAVHFLLEQPFITGICLPVDGGRSIHAPGSLEALAYPHFPSQ